MTEIETLVFPEPFGQLEAFYTSGGSSTLPITYEGKIKNLNYKTIRYPGHCKKFKMMIDLGFIDEETMEIEGKAISRRKVFERLLEETLSFNSGDVMLIRISAEGMKNRMKKRWNYQTIQYEDVKNNIDKTQGK